MCKYVYTENNVKVGLLQKTRTDPGHVLLKLANVQCGFNIVTIRWFSHAVVYCV